MLLDLLGCQAVPFLRGLRHIPTLGFSLYIHSAPRAGIFIHLRQFYKVMAPASRRSKYLDEGTLELSEETKRDITKAERDIRAGRVRSLEAVEKGLGR